MFYESGFKKCQETHKKFKYEFCYVFDYCVSQYQRPVNIFGGFKQIFYFINKPYQNRDDGARSVISSRKYQKHWA